MTEKQTAAEIVKERLEQLHRNREGGAAYIDVSPGAEVKLKRRFPIRLAVVALVAALLAGGLTAGAFSLAGYGHRQQCVASVNANLQKQGEFPLTPDQVERVCKADGDFVVVDVKARY